MIKYQFYLCSKNTLRKACLDYLLTRFSISYSEHFKSLVEMFKKQAYILNTTKNSVANTVSNLCSSKHSHFAQRTFWRII